MSERKVITLPAGTLIAVGVPTHRNSPADFGLCLAACMAFMGFNKVPMIIGHSKATYVDDGRQRCYQYAKEKKASHLWFVDDDMFFPHDACLRLLAHDRDIVGCSYSRRTPPFTNLGTPKDKSITQIKSGLLEMDMLPTGMLLIKLPVLDRVQAYCESKPRDVQDGPAFGYRWLPEKQAYEREDVRFCRLAREIGYQIWCDVTLSHEIEHIGEARYRVQEESKTEAHKIGVQSRDMVAAE